MNTYLIVDFKDSERRAQNQAKRLHLSASIAEPPPIFYKDSERRAQNQAKRLHLSASIAEPPPNLYKDSERHMGKCRGEFMHFS